LLAVDGIVSIQKILPENTLIEFI